jgi:hypothetical protein
VFLFAGARARFGNLAILFAAATRDPNSPYDFSILDDWNSPINWNCTCQA